MKQTSHLGQKGEDMACSYLENKGFVLVQKNFRCRKGEVDLIMKDGEILVFIEVKYRRSLHFGSPFEAIDIKKQEKLLDVSRYYLYTQAYKGPLRFDAVGIQKHANGHRIEHLTDILMS